MSTDSKPGPRRYVGAAIVKGRVLMDRKPFTAHTPAAASRMFLASLRKHRKPRRLPRRFVFGVAQVPEP